MDDNVSLVERVRSGDRIAFNELYKLHYLPLRSYAELMLDADEAEDVVQDVFLNIWLHKEGLDDTLSFRGYLFRSVYNSALNVLKKRSRSDDYRSVCKLEIEEMGYRYYDPDASDVIRKLYSKDLRKDIQAAIDCLPTRCREVFIMSYLEDVPSKEIAHRLEISLSTVDNHIYAALKLLREKLSRHRVGQALLLLVFANFYK